MMDAVGLIQKERHDRETTELLTRRFDERVLALKQAVFLEDTSAIKLARVKRLSQNGNSDRDHLRAGSIKGWSAAFYGIRPEARTCQISGHIRGAMLGHHERKYVTQHGATVGRAQREAMQGGSSRGYPLDKFWPDLAGAPSIALRSASP